MAILKMKRHYVYKYFSKLPRAILIYNMTYFIYAGMYNFYDIIMTYYLTLLWRGQLLKLQILEIGKKKKATTTKGLFFKLLIIRSPRNQNPLLCSVYWFQSFKYAYHNQFQAPNMTSLTLEFRRDGSDC